MSIESVPIRAAPRVQACPAHQASHKSRAILAILQPVRAMVVCRFCLMRCSSLSSVGGPLQLVVRLCGESSPRLMLPVPTTFFALHHQTTSPLQDRDDSGTQILFLRRLLELP